MESTTECKCSRDRHNEPDLLLRLPDDLTPYTKIVLNKIYKKFKNDLQDYEDTLRIFMSRQKAEMKHYIECLVSNTTSEPINSKEEQEQVLHVIGDPENEDVEQEAKIGAKLENSRQGEITTNKCCPPPQPDIRQQFTNNIRELNHILENLLCKREFSRDSLACGRNRVENYDTVPNKVQHDLATSSCPHHSRSASRKRT